MKAIQMSQTGAPGVLEYVDLETPKPGPGQVLVRAEFYLRKPIRRARSQR